MGSVLRQRGITAGVWTVYDTPYSGKPESGFPPYKKERIKKEEPATPALEGGRPLEVVVIEAYLQILRQDLRRRPRFFCLPGVRAEE